MAKKAEEEEEDDFDLFGPDEVYTYVHTYIAVLFT